METTMKRKRCILLLIALLFAAPALSADQLYDGFKNPPNTVRPFVRWKWNDCPTEQEITRELDILKQAGIGGVEICPVAITDVNARMVKFAADAAKQREMTVDLALGSPLAAPFLWTGEQTQIITIGKKTLTGPATCIADANDLINAADETRRLAPDPNRQLMFLLLIPRDLPSFASGEEISDKVSPDGSITFDIPDGNYALYTGVWHQNFRRLTDTAPRADCPILDLLNKKAVEKYLNSISANLAPAFGGKLGDSIHAISCNATELSGANWTTDFSRQFLQRRGYDLMPYLPLVLDDNLPKENTRFYDTIRRVRYDFCATFAELFHERFAQTFHQWCHENGVLSRLQTGYIDTLDGSMLHDIPHSDARFVPGEQPVKPDRIAEILCGVSTKIASSAAHLANKSVVNCESMTGDFRQTLESLKESDDLTFISGINHSVVDGYSYSPPNAAFPGWARTAACLSERNPWWPYFRNFTDRNARLSYLFQNSRHQARIAILCPTADLWSDCGLSPRFVDYIWYLFPLWQALNHNGYTADYLGEKVLPQTTFEDGKLHFGALVYDAIIVPDTFSIEFPAAKALRFFAQAGGKIAFVGEPPQVAPGFYNLFDRSMPVHITMTHLPENDPNRVAFFPAPGKDKDNLIAWTANLMGKISVPPTVRISPPGDDLLFVHYLSDNRDIFFFTNASRTAPVSFHAQFDTADKIPSLWDPETGARSVFPYGDKKNILDIRLSPLESLLVVFDPNTKGKPAPAVDFNDTLEITTPWKADFTNCVTGEKFAREIDKLIDLVKTQDTLLNTFAGTILYRTKFYPPDVWRVNAADKKRTILDLGNVYDISEVKLNDKSLGTRWYGRHTYDTTGVLKKGKNMLEVKVTTTLANYVRSLKDNPALIASKPAPAGLVGPVRLLKAQ
jgi:hypothetical protein